MNRIRSKLTYSNVMSSIAVFAVLGGGAYAAQKLGPKDIRKNAVRAKHVKKNQIRAKHVKRRAIRARHVKPGSIRTNRIGDGAVTEAKLADDVGVAGPVGPQGPPGPATGAAGGDLAGNYPNPVIRNGAVNNAKLAGDARAMWAVVSADGNEIAAQSGGISAKHFEGGTGYHVKFPQPVQGKAIIATPLGVNVLGSPAGDSHIKVSPCGDGPVSGSFPGCTGGGGDNTARDVYVATSNEGSSQDVGFYIAALP